MPSTTLRSSRTASTRPSHVSRLRSLLAAAGLTCLSFGALAQYEATAYTPNGTIIGRTTTPGDVSYAYNDGASSAVVSFTANPVASVAYTLNAVNPLGQVILNGGGIMTYRFEVEAQPFSRVPIDFSGLYNSATTPASAGYGAFTSFLVQTVNSSESTYSTFQSFFQGACAAPICLQYTTFNNTTYTSTQSDAAHVQGSFEGTLDMLTNANGKVIGMVQLFAGGGVNSFFAGGSVSAFIDPHLEIDAAYLAAHPGANLTITDGVGNGPAVVAAVPEPETYALMLAGLAALGVQARRRRRAC